MPRLLMMMARSMIALRCVSTCVVPHGGSARVRGRSEGGWVFCGLERGCGEYMRVAGGRVEYVAGFSGDDCDVEFIITHDGTASTVVVTFNSRAD